MDKESAVTELLKLGFSPDSLKVWKHANCQCEYCGCDLLSSDGEYLYGSNIDHVVPGRGENLDNYALACKACNAIKRNKNFTDGGRLLERKAIIAHAREYILKRREENRLRLQRVKELMEVVLKMP